MADSVVARKERKFGLLAVPGILVSLLPTLSCPLCWPAYAALLSSLGLGFFASSAYLFPLTAVLLGVAVAGLGLQARRNGYGPFLLGLVSAAIILPGKFLLSSGGTTYAGVVRLLMASIWAVVPR